MKSEEKDNRDANRDPMTGAPGAHPIGTALGAAAGGAAAGAAVGTVAGPAGTLLGAVAGAVIGGLAGKAVGEVVDPTIEDAYWSKIYAGEPYYYPGRTYGDYAPAYRTGYTGRTRYPGRRFEEIEGDLESNYNLEKGASRLSWREAKPATRAAWDRFQPL